VKADLFMSPDLDRADVRINPGESCPFAVISLGEYIRVHVKIPADARELAAAFTEAADGLEQEIDRQAAEQPASDIIACLHGHPDCPDLGHFKAAAGTDRQAGA
jgi:hypothetical protein